MHSERKDPQCRRYREQESYSHTQEVIDNIPYILMLVTGAAIFWIGFDDAVWGTASALLYLVFGLTGTIWIILFVCPYCHYYGTRLCPCGYGQIAPKLRKKGQKERFNEKFRKHIFFIVPLWLLPAGGAVVFLVRDLSLLMMALLALFTIDSYMLLPLLSRKYGCAHCPQKDTCPWMGGRRG